MEKKKHAVAELEIILCVVSIYPGAPQIQLMI